MEEQIEEEGGLIPENTDLIDLMESDHEDEEFDDEIEEEQGKTQEEKEQEEEAVSPISSYYTSNSYSHCFFVVLYLSGCCDCVNPRISSCL